MKIAIVIDYQPNPENYANCETVEDCLKSDVEGLNARMFDPMDMLSICPWEARIIDE